MSERSLVVKAPDASLSKGGHQLNYFFSLNPLITSTVVLGIFFKGDIRYLVKKYQLMLDEQYGDLYEI